jgi:oligopeptide/dipeptide ABC transporter ATP-binding protein
MQDASSRGKILEILLRRVRQGSAMILTTHDLYLAAAAAKRGIVLYRGHVVETGPADTLLQGGLHPYTKALVKALPRLGERVHRPPVVDDSADPGPGACPFALRCPERFAKCKEAPPLVALSQDRSVACWRVEGN